MNASQKTESNDKDCALLRYVAEGDRDAFSELFALYHGRLFKFIYRLTHSYSTSEELVNDIMLLVWRKASTFRGASKVSTWIFGIAYRQTMKRLSRDKHGALQYTGTTDNIAADSPLTETQNWVRQGLRSLSDAQQVTAMLVFYVGLSYEEVSEITDCPVSTVKTRMFHARRKLREILPQIAQPIADRDKQDPDTL